MAEQVAGTLCERLLATKARVRTLRVASFKDFLKATKDPNTIAFLDSAALELLTKDKHTPPPVLSPGQVIAICEQRLPAAVAWLAAHGWLAHVMSGDMLQHPMSVELLSNVLSTLQSKSEPKLLDWMGDVAGRRVLLTQASKRTERLERMTDFLEAKGLTGRIVHQLRDVAEELVTNAFYDAPVAAGAVKQAIPRTQDVTVPDDDACDLIYGVRDDVALVRVQDPFGALSRTRLVEVLSRCAHADMQVQVDETMGGAGLGLWRIFAAASFVALSVVNNRHTEFLVGIARRRSPGPHPFAVHLFFTEGPKRRFWQMWDTDSNDLSVGQSVTILKK